MGRKKSKLTDFRLERVFETLKEAMSHKLSVVLHQLADNKTEEVRLSRFIHNERLDENNLVAYHCQNTVHDLSNRHILIVEDTTTASFSPLAGRENLGYLDDKTDKDGFYLHGAMYMDAADGACYGLGGLHSYQVDSVDTAAVKAERKARQKRLAQIPFNKKNRYKWYNVAEKAIQNRPDAKEYTIVGDREADIYELLARYDRKQWGYVIRNAYNRNIQNEQGEVVKLHHQLSQWDIQHYYELNLAATKKRSAHKANLEVKFGAIQMIKGRHIKDKSLPKILPMYVVEVKENPSSVVGKEKPVHWILLTSHPVHTVEQAMQIIQWYCWRWSIEQVFRTLKKQGLDIQKSTVKSFHGLLILSVMALIVATNVMQLVQARDGKTEQKVKDVFSPKEQQCLQLLNKKVNGRTKKSQNPHHPSNLAFATWIIARLGGWNGYQSERKPGPIIILRGLIRFFDTFNGFVLLN